MKRILISLVPILVILSGCAGTTPSPKSPEGYSIQQTTKYSEKFRNSIVGSVSVEYKDYNMLLDEKMKKLENRMASTKEIKAASKTIPKGGIAIILIKRISIGIANTENFEYVVHQNGKEIYRRKGSNTVANVPSSDDMWWNIGVVELSKPIQGNIVLYVIDNATGIRDTFIISKSSKQ